MTTYNKISALVQDQFPEFVTEEGPKLIAFTKAYYEWMEQSGNLADASKNILSYQDIDTTLDQYLQYFKTEILKNIPDNTIVDKKLLAKHITDLYRSKASEKSFKFLFRALYNEDIDIYYPGDYVLRTSDGRWQQDTVVRVTGLTLQEAETLAGQLITGQTSGAYGRVESIAETVEFGILVIELVLSNIIGTFIDTETVLSDGSNLSATIYSSTGSLQNIILQIDFRNLPRGSGGGVFHRSGDLITFTSDAGSGANGVIISTDDRSAINVGITFGGSGYVNNLPVIITGSSGYGAAAKVTGIGSLEVLSICSDTIYSMRNVPLNAGPTFISTGANTAAVSANLAGANIYSSLISGLLFSNVTTAITGYMRQSVTSSNTLIGNGGTNFTQLQVGDTIYSTNSVGSISRFVRVVSVAGASSMVTSPSINSTAEYFQYTSTSTTGARIKLAPPLLESQDVIIFDTYGGSPDGQYAVNVVASTINTVFTISSQYMGSTLSNGTFTYIDN